jgi:rhodanese-related sulfurtransferase
MKRGWLKLLLSLSFLSVTTAFSAEHTNDTLEEVQEGLAHKKAVLVDVRELREWQAGHLADAQLVPLSALGKKSNDPGFVHDLSQRLGKEQGKVIYVHCKSGRRCLIAADALTKLGYDARPLKQGYEDLLKAGFKASVDDSKKDSR